MKKKILLSPLIIIILIIVLGIGAAGAAVLLGGGGGTEEVNLQKGLVGHWDFNGNAKDSTPYRNHGTVTGAIFATDRKGQANKAYDFDGATAGITANGLANIIKNDQQGTISLWVKREVQGTSHVFFGVANNSGSGFLDFNFSAVNKLSATFRTNSSSNTVSWVSSVAAPDWTTAWNHIVLTSTGSSYQFYVNGAAYAGASANQAGTGAVGDWFGDFASLATMASIGKSSRTTPFYFDGLIDDVRVYNRALSQAEVTALYGSYDPGIIVSDLQKGLVSHWKFDGNAKDSTPNRKHGTVTGAIFTTDRKGQANKAYSFDGNDYISYGNILDSTFTGASKDFTVALWFKTPNPGSDWTHWLIQYADAWSVQFGVGMAGLLDGASFGKLQIQHNNNVGLGYSGATYKDGLWHHLVVTRNDSGNQVKIYVDTNLDGTLGDVTVGNADKFYIGAQVTDPASRYWNGSVDDVRVYNRVISSAEISALYQSYNPSVQVSDLQKGLVGNWKFDGNAKDKTPYRNSGTVTGATLSIDRKGQANKAYSFNGSSNYVDCGSNAILQPTRELTIAAWINPSVMIKDQRDWAKVVSDFIIDAGQNRYGFFLETIGHSGSEGIIGAGGYIGSGIDDAFALYTSAKYTTTVNQWLHIVVTLSVSAGKAKLYVNGVLEATDNVVFAIVYTGQQSLYIGAGPLSVIDHYFTGSIDDVRIYNRALSQAEVTALYESY